MAVITGISENRGLITIYADGSALIRIRKKHFAKLPLSQGDDIEPEAYLDAISSIQFPDAYEAALTLLDFSMRTAGELRKGLVRRGYAGPAAEAAVAKLVEVGLINDRDYAARITETASRKAVGVYSLRRKLMAKGISEADAEVALEALDDAQQLSAAKTAAEKLGRKYRDLEPREARRKLSQALARRGFSWDIISSALDGMDEE